jgi:hypothetical protein
MTLTSTGIKRESEHHAVYNARNPCMLVSFSRIARRPSILLLILLQVTRLKAADWRSPEEQLAAKIVAVTGPGADSLQLTNRSSLSRADVDQVYRGLLAELETRGVRVVDREQAGANLEISLSEDLHHYVWVAEIQQGSSKPSVVMVSQRRPAAPSQEPEKARMTIRKSLLWSQPTRILDLALVAGTPSRMIVLDSETITIYSSPGGLWQKDQVLPVSASHPWPADMRGRLVLRPDHGFDAFLPGAVCRSTAAEPSATQCDASDDPWPLLTGMGDQPVVNAFFASTRNFFTGALAPGIATQTAVAPFFSAAALPRDKSTLWLLATVDGPLQALDGAAPGTVNPQHWGSDLASLHSGCGSGWQVLASGDSDSGADTVQAFEVPDREPVAVSPPVEFSGNITALWTNKEGNGAVAVSHDSTKGIYEAFLLTLACTP